MGADCAETGDGADCAVCFGAFFVDELEDLDALEDVDELEDFDELEDVDDFEDVVEFEDAVEILDAGAAEAGDCAVTGDGAETAVTAETAEGTAGEPAEFIISTAGTCWGDGFSAVGAADCGGRPGRRRRGGWVADRGVQLGAADPGTLGVGIVAPPVTRA